MYRCTTSTDKRFRLGRWCCAVVMVSCLGLSGCANLDLCGGGLRGNRYAEAERANWTREIPLPDAQGELFGLSNTAQQVEQNVLDRSAGPAGR